MAEAFYVLLTIFLLLPLAGYVFNGFGYVANRWVFAYAFLVRFYLPVQYRIC